MPRQATAQRRVYKILRAHEWEDLIQTGSFMGSPDDLRDGFIHLSYRTQLQETARRHFSGTGPLVLLAMDRAEFGAALKDELSRNKMLFPHLYARIPVSAVLWHTALTRDTHGIPVIPELPEG